MHGDRWVLTSQHQLVASTQDTIDIILSRYPIICMVKPITKLSNLEMMYVTHLDFSPFILLLKRCLAKFGADKFHVTVRCILQQIHYVMNTWCNKCILAKRRTNRYNISSQGGSALNLHLFQLNF